MKEMTLEFHSVSIKKSEKENKRWSRVLLGCSLIGVFCNIGGLLISGLSLANLIDKNSFADRLGTWLIVVSFPLILFGAHALDKLKEIEKSEKRKKYGNLTNNKIESK